MNKLDVTFFKNNKSYFLVIIGIVMILFICLEGIISNDLEQNLVHSENSSDTLRITEIMSDNNGAYTDVEGNDYDWIELYNETEHPINLENYGLSDSEDEKVKWLFPSYTIEPGQYLVVYLASIDKDGLYANFSLKKSGGESVVLTNSSGTIIDKVPTKKIDKNNSMALSDDDKFIVTSEITPGYSNDETGREAYLESLKVSDENLIITEILTINKGNYLVEHKLPSYLEIKNISDSSINLSDYYLSTDINRPFLWRLPEYTLKSGEVYLIYTDSLDRDNHASFELNKQNGSVYLSYKNKVIDEVNYKDIPNGFAYMLVNESFIVTSNISPGYDNTDVGINQYMSTRDVNPKELIISEVTTSNNKFLAQNGGKFYNWIELYNNTDKDINLSKYVLSTDKDNNRMYILPNVILKSHSYYTVMASGKESLSNKMYKHTNFKLSTIEGLYLYRNGTIIDSMFINNLPTNYSYGRGNQSGHYYFNNPTPNKRNSKGYIEVALEPNFSVEAGKYDNIDQLKLELNGKGTIYYTLDGSNPTLKSKVYKGPLLLNKTTTVKAIHYYNHQKSSIVTNTYIINEKHTLPIVSLTIKPTDLSLLNINYTSNRVYPVHVELLDEQSKFSVDCGIKMFGGDSRSLNKKSYALKFSSKYGVRSLKYKVFDNRDAVSYDTLVLRSGSQDMSGTMFKDELVTSIIDDYGTVDVQANKPVILYINSQYYGIYYLREKIDEEFVQNHYNVNPNNTNIARIDYDLTSGSTTFLRNINTYVSTHDMSRNDNYQYITKILDIDNYLDLWIAQIFTGDYDVRNVRYFNNPNIDNGKIKMIAYDFDYAFYNYPANYFTWMTDPNGMGYFHIDNKLMLNLLKNKQFKKRFVERLAYNLNNVWTIENIMNNYNKYYKLLTPEIKRDRARWNFSYKEWQTNCSSVKKFLAGRRSKIISQTKRFFNLSDQEVKKLFI